MNLIQLLQYYSVNVCFFALYRSYGCLFAKLWFLFDFEVVLCLVGSWKPVSIPKNFGLKIRGTLPVFCFHCMFIG